MQTNPRLVLVAEKATPPRFATDALRSEGLSPVWVHVARLEDLNDTFGRTGRPHAIVYMAGWARASTLDALAAMGTGPGTIPIVILAKDMRVGEAVDLIKAGAENVVEMGDGARLAAVIRRVVDSAEPEGEFDQLGDAVFHAAREAIVVTDAANRILAVNAGFTAASGYAEAEVLGKESTILASGREDAGFFQRMAEDIQRDGHWEGEVWNRRKNGEVYPEWLSVSVMRDGEGRIVRHIAIYSDISERKRDEQALHHRAHHDPLTNLPNRALGLDRLAQALATAHRRRSKVAVMFVDLDGFKPVNDMLGHQAGDDLLCQVARRMESCIRESDTVYRFGGDEFVIVVTDVVSEGAAAKVANNVLAALAHPFEVRKRSVAISASIGVAFYPLHGEEAAELVHVADEAMYAAKRAGKNRSVTAPEKATDAA